MQLQDGGHRGAWVLQGLCGAQSHCTDFFRMWHEQETNFCGVKAPKFSYNHNTAKSSSSRPGPLTRGLLEMQILRFHTPQSKSEPEGGTSDLGFNGSPGDPDTSLRAPALSYPECFLRGPCLGWSVLLYPFPLVEKVKPQLPQNG